jgi:hypothetical protein
MTDSLIQVARSKKNPKTVAERRPSLCAAVTASWSPYQLCYVSTRLSDFHDFPQGLEFVEQYTCIFEQLVEHRALSDMSRLFAKLIHAELLTMGFVRGEALNDICI